MLKLYHGGCGTARGFIVAEEEGKAIHDLSHKLGIPFLPVTVEEVSVDGYTIELMPHKKVKSEPVQTVPTGEEGGEVVEDDSGDGIGRETEGAGETTGKSSGGKSRARKKSDQ